MAKRPSLTLVPPDPPGFGPSDDLAKLFADRLTESGISLADAKRFRLKAVSATEAKRLNFWPLPGLIIPYFEPNDKYVPLHRPGAEPMFRIRALRNPVPMPQKFAKYLQPKGSYAHAYFTPSIDWPGIANDTSIDLNITEGELKSIKACLEGYPTIGIGGVYNFSTKKRDGLDLLPELEPFMKPGRRVNIIFDNDLKTNPNVSMALNALARVLRDRGVNVYRVILPSINGLQKVGLDDYLISPYNHEMSLLEYTASYATPIAATDVLWNLNDRFAYITEFNEFIDINTARRYKPSAIGDLVNEQLQVHIDNKGKLNWKPTPAGPAWMHWSHRYEVRQLVYKPWDARGAPDKFPPSDVSKASPNDIDYNMFTGWGVAPRAGNHKPFLDLIQRICAGAEPEASQWLLRWLAYPLQHPGTKLFTSVMIWGFGEGTGKTLIPLTMGRLYGKNYKIINQKYLENGHNRFADGACFIMGDDISGTDKRSDADRLKIAITQETVTIDQKYIAPYIIKDTINYIWTSNHQNALLLSDYDRRFFVLEVNSTDPLPDKFVDNYMKWLDHDNGAAAVFDYLLNLDLGDFRPNGKAFATEAKQRMTRQSKSSHARWVDDLKADPDATLVVGAIPVNGDLFTIKTLTNICCQALAVGLDTPKISTMQIARELTRVGIKQIHNGKPVTLPGQPQDRYYAVRRADKWLNAPLSAIQKHLE